MPKFPFRNPTPNFEELKKVLKEEVLRLALLSNRLKTRAGRRWCN